MKQLLITLITSFLLSDEVISIQPRIYNGVPAKIENTKYQVSIRNKLLDQFYFGLGHFCGGVLISPKLVVTAAHCLANENLSFYSIVMGTVVKNVKNNNTLVLDAKEIVVHPHYDKQTLFYDIGLVFLAESVRKNVSSVQPIKLAGHTAADDTICQVSGWGKTENNVLSDKLLTVDVPIVPLAKCNDSYEGQLMQMGQICAGYMTVSKDACQGDSGGPLVCENLLTGIVSGGEGCGKFGKPGVYVDVAFSRDWILTEAMKRNVTIANKAQGNMISLAVVGAMLLVSLFN